jgi:type I restriction enzyme, R subunit
MRSLNFEFLKTHEPLLTQLGAAAERYCFEDPNVSLYKLRQFGELLAQLAAGSIGLTVARDTNQMTLLRDLESRGVIRGDVQRLFHEIRKTGNNAVHSLVGNQRIALEHLRYACFLGIWFHRSFGGAKEFKAAFIPPKPMAEPEVSLESTLLQKEIARLNAELAEQVSAAELAEADRWRQAQQLESLTKSIEQSEEEKQQIQAKLTALETQAQSIAAPKLQSLVNRAADTLIDLDEAATRRLIDQQLRDAGWNADSELLVSSQGTRPEKGQNLAIAEYPIGRRFADYVLFMGLQPVAVIEAKRRHTNVQSDALDQAIERYAKKFPGGPLPFAFATNGKPFQAQIKSKSGIWFQDLRRETERSRAIGSWFRPEELQKMLGQDLDAAEAKLKNTAFADSFGLYDFQKAAIQAVETAIVEDKREVMLAMATGTGKTRTAIALCYRLLQTNRFRRILFLVDRSVLGNQTGEKFQETSVTPTQRFTDVFDLKELKEIVPDVDTRVQIATVQGLVKRILYANDGHKPSAGQYDCIIVDECHRGYTLDREMSDAELEFRDFNDYLSKYRQVLDYFDAVKIGLTATPAPHTATIFGPPVFYYSYNQAVSDRKLVPYEPPIEILTALAEDGITWKKGEAIETINPVTNTVDLLQAPDEMSIEVEQFNRKVIVPEFNRVVCETLCDRIDPFGQGKTLIFCVTDLHADEVVKQLEQALCDRYGEAAIHRDLVKKITGAADDPQGWTKRFQNEQYPNIVVTVDLLTTGVDVPKITNLVFLRRVNSRILYDQMLGRGTRLCVEIEKEAFQVFDAVGVCELMAKHSDMKATVVTPKTSFSQLTNYVIDSDLTNAKANLIANGMQAIDQWLAKLQRQQSRWDTDRQAQFTELAGMPVEQLTPFIRSQIRQGTPLEGLQAVQTWLSDRQDLVTFLDQRQAQIQPLWIASHEDELRRVDRYYGVAAESGADYLERFQAFLASQNAVMALTVVTQRPRELTRSQLREVRELLGNAGFEEKALEVAWREQTNQEIAASIIGFIRQAAIGDALVPWGERVDRAMEAILASQTWTMPQKKWLERIAKSLKHDLVVDQAALDQGAFQSMGGFKQGDKLFGGQLAAVLAAIGDRLWDGA